MTLAGQKLRARASTSPSFFVPPDRPSPTSETLSKRTVTPTAAGEFHVSSLPPSQADPPLKLSTGKTASTAAAVDEAAPTHGESTIPCTTEKPATTSGDGHPTPPVYDGVTNGKNTAPPSPPLEGADAAQGGGMLDTRGGGGAVGEEKCPRGTESLGLDRDGLAAPVKMERGCLQPLAGKCSFDGCGKVCFRRNSGIWHVGSYGSRGVLHG